MKNELNHVLKPQVRQKQAFLQTLYRRCKSLLDTAKPAQKNNNKIADVFKQALDVSTDLITYMDLFLPTSLHDPKAALKQADFYTNKARELASLKARVQRYQALALTMYMAFLFPSPASAFMVIAGLGLEIGMQVFKQKRERHKLRRVVANLRRVRTELDTQINSVNKKCAVITKNWYRTLSNFRVIVSAVRTFAVKIKAVFPKFNVVMTNIGTSGISQGNILSKQRSLLNYIKTDMIRKLQDAFQANYKVTMKNIDEKIALVKTIIQMVKGNSPIRNIFASIPTSKMTSKDVIRVIAKLYLKKKCYSSYPLDPIRKGQDHFMYRIQITKQMSNLVINLTYGNMAVNTIKLTVNGATGANLSDEETVFLIAATRPELTTYLGNNLKSVCG